MQHLEEIVSSLRDEGFRITPQRIAIVDYLLKTEDHPSAELIHKVVRKRYPMVSLSTVYKTLDLLREKKLVNEIEVEGEARFDAHTDEHINLVCMKCGKIDDIDEDSLKEIQVKAAKKSKYLILKSNFELHGYCHNCKSKMK
ncbi:Fur family transcriptional regulator [Nitrosopumilus sp.]|jgi:Fur family peroxide stress response transcriptional regulator|uniref:Fur family transcriptional regulator n=1 Tax=Nitrosopumilus sp. TaxID=2024843 RepID=UPI00247C7407|nr:Fur family transcriptional regulator [Nitrosopumilus sp.]MCV0410278.1 transcriptional repressor [Nitrosopumilus sp.]